MATQMQGWQIVQRRRVKTLPNPGGSRSPKLTRELQVYNSLRPSFAQTLLNQSSPTTIHTSGSPSSMASPKRKVLPPSSITSPDSPVSLRYPPKAMFEEWRRRCFRCFKKGHISNDCTNARRCAICWQQGHDFGECPKATRFVEPPVRSSPSSPPRLSSPVVEPDFSELLHSSSSSYYTAGPEDHERPMFSSCYLVRDDAYSQEIARLLKSLVISIPPEFEFSLTLDEIAQQVASTGLVTTHQLKVSTYTRGRYFVEPPDSVLAIDLAKAFPDSWWNLGFSAQLWSPLIDSEIEVPGFKVWIDLLGIPPHLFREFGVYLGTISNGEPGNLACWSAAIAVPDLRSIPRFLRLFAAPFRYEIPVSIKRWKAGPVYSPEDIPRPPPNIV